MKYVYIFLNGQQQRQTHQAVGCRGSFDVSVDEARATLDFALVECNSDLTFSKNSDTNSNKTTRKQKQAGLFVNES